MWLSRVSRAWSREDNSCPPCWFFNSTHTSCPRIEIRVCLGAFVSFQPCVDAQKIGPIWAALIWRCTRSHVCLSLSLSPSLSLSLSLFLFLALLMPALPSLCHYGFRSTPSLDLSHFQPQHVSLSQTHSLRVSLYINFNLLFFLLLCLSLGFSFCLSVSLQTL